ncbi:MAG: hypothetical protein DMF86_24260, partial [Acidobacteria bacterium]
DMQADGPTKLAFDTGGLAIRNENNFGRALDEIARDAATFYVLGYAPSNQTFDGKYRSIGVKVNRPGVTARARRGYLASEPAKMLLPPPAVTTSARAAATPVPPVPTLPATESPKSAAATVTPESTAATVAPEPVAATVSKESGTGTPTTIPGVRTRVDAGRMLLDLGKSDDPKGEDEASKGWAAYQRGDVETASTYLVKAAASGDAQAWVHYALGLSQFALQHYPDAAGSFERVRAAAPEFEPVYFNLADVYLLQHSEANSLRVLREAQRRWPKDEEVYNAVGVIQVRRGALDAAIETFQEAIRISPNDALAYFNLAKVYHLRSAKAQRYDTATQKWTGGDGDRKKAAEYYQKYIDLGGPYAQEAKDALAALNWRS